MKNMKKLIILTALALIPAAKLTAQDAVPLPDIYEKNLKFCEGTVLYKHMVLVSNFGTETLEPLNNEGKGYIVAIDGAKTSVFIPADGNLSAPKGMAIHSGHLFIADVGRVVVYNLRRIKEKPQVIKFSDDDLFVNDIVGVGDMLLVSVTNTGRLYGLDVSEMEQLAYRKPILLGNVPGANGLAISESNLYIASYNPSGTPEAENVIYVANIAKPGEPLKKLISGLSPGQYDGIAVSADGTKLYFSSWTTRANIGAAIWVYNLEGKTAARLVDLQLPFKGPADISIKGTTLWVPDLVQSKVYRIDL